ncbi:hypothetical protein [Chryseobacterium luquanense]|uniref:Lipoprotein n=1 Tax=Chryseobacterium luquanense TaxID=2983766 RepID=A0ABT3Y1R2_9FLAO|nr:hypothetical protein [Chryseobacterium luquanense]MCX8532076.1 hypothetical protein [Chryseobacterium luquanense]
MKKILIITILMSIISCKPTSKMVSGVDYKIIKIDSLETIYIIYAEKSDVSIRNSKIIKIASSKKNNKCKRKNLINIGQIYKLNLVSLYPENFVSHHNLGGITYNSIYVPFDKDYNVKKDLFITENLEGLCYKISK